MLEWFAPSKEYHYLTYTIAEDIVNYYLGQQDFDKALESVQNLRLYRRNRYDIPYYQLIRGPNIPVPASIGLGRILL